MRIANDPVALLAGRREAGDGRGGGDRGDLRLVLGGGPVAGAVVHRVHLAHPSGNDWGNRRVKNDERDARDLADLLRLGRLAEAWIAPPAVRELRELVRYRAKLVAAALGAQGPGARGDGAKRACCPA